jgi:hypothetical protein
MTSPGGLSNTPYVGLSVAGGGGGIGSTPTILLALDQAPRRGVFGLNPLTEMAEPVRLTSCRCGGVRAWPPAVPAGAPTHGRGRGLLLPVRCLPTPVLTVVVLTNLARYDCAGLVRSIVDTYVPAPPTTVEPTGSTVEGRSGVCSDATFTIDITAPDGLLMVDADEGIYRMRPITAQLYVDADDPMWA